MIYLHFKSEFITSRVSGHFTAGDAEVYFLRILPRCTLLEMKDIYICTDIGKHPPWQFEVSDLIFIFIKKHSLNYLKQFEAGDFDIEANHGELLAEFIWTLLVFSISGVRMYRYRYAICL